MKDLNVLIAGGSNGLGALLAEMAAEAGATGVGIIDIDAENGAKVLEKVAAMGVKTALSVADISTSAETKRGFSEILEKLGTVDTMINCVAIYPRRPILEITDEEWDASNGANVKGTYHMMAAAAKHMRELEPRDNVRGRIVNITSVDAFKAHPVNVHYAATKAAVASLTRSFAHHLAPDGILVNSVAPAGMATEKARMYGFLEELARAAPLDRAALPREIAEWVMMTGGPKNTYMTGENVIVSGGYIYA